MSWWMQLLACIVATMAYSGLIKLPWKATWITALIAVIGYGVFLLLDQSTMGYFMAALAICILCEMAARMLKMAATLFSTGAIIPLVPGVGLYRTMRYMVEGDAQMAVSTGTATLLGLCGIALAMTLTAVFVANLRPKIKKKDPVC